MSSLHEAILSKDITQMVRNLASLNQEKLTNLLAQKYENETLADIAVRVDPKLIYGLKLHSLTREHPIFIAIDLMEKHLLNEKTHKVITAKRLAKKLDFIKNYITNNDNITLSLFEKRPKFISTALLLGCKICNSNIKDQTLLHFVLYSAVLSRTRKKSLLAWLIENKFVTESTLSVAELSKLISFGSHDVVKLLLKVSPSMLEERDKEGQNILQYALEERIRLFMRCWSFVQSNLHPDQFFKLLITPTIKGDVFAASYCKKYWGVCKTKPEVIDACRYLASKNNQQALKQLFYSNRHIYKNPILVYYMAQEGMEMTYQINLPDNVKSLDQFLSSMKQPTEKNQIDSKNTVPKSTQSMLIERLPSELLYVVASQLEPEALINFFMVNKAMTKYLRSTSNETFWKTYYHDHYSPFHPSTFSYKTKVMQEIRGQSNWQKNKYHAITMSNTQPRLMDENWLVLFAKYTYMLWNCHTQTLFECPLDGSFTPIQILSHYNSNELPSLLVDSGQYGAIKLSVARSSTDLIELKKVNEFLLPSNNNFEGLKITQINTKHHVVFPKGASLVDLETESFIGHMGNLNTNFDKNCYNPYNNTIVISKLNRMEIYDTNCKLLHTLNNNTYIQSVHAVDEHTLFFRGMNTGWPCAFLDLRTGKELFSMKNLINGWRNPVVTRQRCLFMAEQATLLTSLNLSTRKIEWIQPQHNKLDVPVETFTYGVQTHLANSRYLVYSARNETHISDYCSNKIRYD